MIVPAPEGPGTKGSTEMDYQYTVTCASCAEPFPAPADYDPERSQWCADLECQAEGAEAEAWTEALYSQWNENVKATYGPRREMTSSELHRAQDALRAIWRSHPAAVAL